MKKWFIFLSTIVLLFSCSKPSDINVQKKEDLIQAKKELNKIPFGSLLTDPEVLSLFIDYHFSIGTGYAIISFLNAGDSATFDVELKINDASYSSQSVAVNGNSGITVTFNLWLMTSGKLTTVVKKGTKSFSASCSIYDATTNPSNPIYKGSAISTPPVMTILSYTNPTSGIKFRTPQLKWTSWPTSSSSETIYAAMKYVYPYQDPTVPPCYTNTYYGSNNVVNNQIDFTSVNNQSNFCVYPTYIDYVWERKYFDADTVSFSRWQRVPISFLVP